MPVRKKKRLQVERSSGNVFADLGLPNAEELATKADLVIRLKALIRQSGLSRIQAARLLGEKPKKLEDLFCGSLDEFSVDRILRFINLLSHDVEIVIHQGANGKRVGSTRIVSA